jgi:hypothetical protein
MPQQIRQGFHIKVRKAPLRHRLEKAIAALKFPEGDQYGVYLVELPKDWQETIVRAVLKVLHSA